MFHKCIYCCMLTTRFKTLRDANMDLMKLCEEHDTSYERGRLDMQQYRYRLVRAKSGARPGSNSNENLKKKWPRNMSKVAQ